MYKLSEIVLQFFLLHQISITVNRSIIIGLAAELFQL